MNYSQITDTLFIGTTPQPASYPVLCDLGVQLVINMRLAHRPHPEINQPPLSALWLPTFDSPFVPIPFEVLKRGVTEALEKFRSGGKVYVHCAAGRHRSVAMGAAILIAQGHKPEDAIRLIKSNRLAADPDIWYIRRRIVGFAERWLLNPPALQP